MRSPAGGSAAPGCGEAASRCRHRSGPSAGERGAAPAPTCAPSPCCQKEALVAAAGAVPPSPARRMPPHGSAAAAAHGRPAAPPPRCLPSPSGEARPAPLGGKEGGKAGFIPLRRRPAGVGALRRPRRPLRSPSRREPRLRLRPGSEARFVPVSPQDRSLTLMLRPDKCLAPSFTTKNREALRETNQTPAVPRHSSAGNSLPSFPRP